MNLKILLMNIYERMVIKRREIFRRFEFGVETTFKLI